MRASTQYHVGHNALEHSQPSEYFAGWRDIHTYGRRACERKREGAWRDREARGLEEQMYNSSKMQKTKITQL